MLILRRIGLSCLVVHLSSWAYDCIQCIRNMTTTEIQGHVGAAYTGWDSIDPSWLKSKFSGKRARLWLQSCPRWLICAFWLQSPREFSEIRLSTKRHHRLAATFVQHYIKNPNKMMKYVPKNIKCQ